MIARVYPKAAECGDAALRGVEPGAGPGAAPGPGDPETAVATPECELCDDTGWRLVEEDGRQLVRPCVCDERRKRARLLEIARIPKRYEHCTLDSFELWDPDDPTLTAALRRVRDFTDAYPHVDRGLLLMGGVGTGKTHLAIAVLKELIQRYGAHGRFVDLPTLVQEIQMTFDGPGNARELLAPLIGAKLLVVDELGAGRPSQWALDILYYLVNTRYLEQRLTLFTTNFTDFPRAGEESFSDRVSARIRSRLFEMCERVELRGMKDYREHRDRQLEKRSRLRRASTERLV
jgi:DNA replication protein DnaC